MMFCSASFQKFSLLFFSFLVIAQSKNPSLLLAQKIESKTILQVLPILKNPVSDPGLPVLSVMVDVSEKKKIKVAYIWKNEHFPLSQKVDLAYALLRRLPRGTTNWSWGRVRDVEWITLHYREEDYTQLNSITFHSYSEGASWAGVSLESTVTIAASKLEFEGKRPVIYANTWNHTLGERNTSGRKVKEVKGILVLKSYPGKGVHSSGGIWASQPHFQITAPDLALPSLSNTPLIAFQNKIFYFSRNSQSNIQWKSNDLENNWSSFQQTKFFSNQPPQVFTFQNRIYLAWSDTLGFLYWATFHPKHGFSSANATKIQTKKSFSFLIFRKNLYLSWPFSDKEQNIKLGFFEIKSSA